MVEIKLNGKPFNPQTLENAVVQAAAANLRVKLGSIRHPVTGEFPTIAITGSSLADLKIRVEGSPELVALVREHLAGSEEIGPKTMEPQAESAEHKPHPKAFLSYAFDDAQLARRIAEALQAAGVDTWWAGWCIAAGDSIRQRIDEGLADCTHFIVLLTPRSVSKPWVMLEMDAGLVRKLNTDSKFIALRSDLSSSNLPPLLQGMLSPEVDANALDISQLISDIHGVTKKPPLGHVPEVVTQSEVTKTGYSPAANGLAQLFVTDTKQARKLDPNYSVEALASRLGLSVDDVVDAAHELNGMITYYRHSMIYAEDELFVRFDKFWMPWDPVADALRIATEMVNDDAFPTSPGDIAKIFGWEARRMNPALAYLANRKLAMALKAFNSGPWLLATMHKTDATRRFVKSRQ